MTLCLIQLSDAASLASIPRGDLGCKMATSV